MSNTIDTFAVRPMNSLLTQLQRDIAATAATRIRGWSRQQILHYPKSSLHAEACLDTWGSRYIKYHRIQVQGTKITPTNIRQLGGYCRSHNLIQVLDPYAFRSRMMWLLIIWHELFHHTGSVLRKYWGCRDAYRQGYKRREEHVADLGTWYCLWQAHAPKVLRYQEILSLYAHGVLKQMKPQQQAIEETYKAIQYVAKIVNAPVFQR